jgi:hypothetical protein
MITQELLDLKFQNWADGTNRHTLFVHNAVLSDRTIVNYPSARFNGLSYLEIYDNESDWLLGSTLNTNRARTRNWYPTNSDNEFTIDTWIYLVPSSSRYQIICSSFKSKWWTNAQYDFGWSFRVDTQTGKLQLTSYVFGNFISRVLETFGSVSFNEWNHISLMSWKTGNASSKLFFINGQPDGAYDISDPIVKTNRTGATSTENFPISNAMSHESQFGIPGESDTCPFYIGMGPRTALTNPGLNAAFYFKKEYGIGFNGYLGRFRVSLGTRYSNEGIPFDPLTQYDEIITTTTTATTTTESTSTTQSEWGEIPLILDSEDLLALKLRNDLVDLTNRHYIKSVGKSTFSSSELGCKSLNFTGNNYLKVILNQKDFSLGSMLVINQFITSNPVCLNNNKFSLEFWIKPQSVNSRYLGICGSYSTYFFPTDTEDTINYGSILYERDYKIGWSIYLDTTTGKLYINSYAFGQIVDKLESNLLITVNEWNHIALMSKPEGLISAKYLFINGIPDSINPYRKPATMWTNGVHRASINSMVDSHACLFIGISANDFLDDNSLTLDYRQGLKFTGNISNFRLSSGLRYPTDGSNFIPDSIPTTTSTITTMTTTQTTTTLTTTTLPPEGYVKVGGKIVASSSQADGKPQYVNDSNIDTAWEPIISLDAWVGIECDDTGETSI